MHRTSITSNDANRAIKLETTDDMQSANQFNSASVSMASEQRDDTESRDQSIGHDPHSKSAYSTTNSSSLKQFHTSLRDQWSRRLSNCMTTSDEGYSCQEVNTSGANNYYTSTATMLVNKLKQLQVPQTILEGRSPLTNDLVGHDSQSNNIHNQRKQILSMLQSKSDLIVHETQKSWKVIVEKAEVGKHILEEAKIGNKMVNKLVILNQFTDGRSNLECCKDVTLSKHTREVSFDYQLMSDVDYSNAPCNNASVQLMQ